MAMIRGFAPDKPSAIEANDPSEGMVNQTEERMNKLDTTGVTMTYTTDFVQAMGDEKVRRSQVRSEATSWEYDNYTLLTFIIN